MTVQNVILANTVAVLVLVLFLVSSLLPAKYCDSLSEISGKFITSWQNCDSIGLSAVSGKFITSWQILWQSYCCFW